MDDSSSARERARYEGTHIAVDYDVQRCIHAGECVRGLPQVFDPDRHPWVDADAADADSIADVVQRCPTGALRFRRNDGAPGEPLPTENVIEVQARGPLFLRGDLELTDGEGSPCLRETRMALCRCGASRGKPFCDGSHQQARFDHNGEVEEDQAPRPQGGGPGPLRVHPTPDGPLMLDGSFRLLGAMQRGRHDGIKAALCRCGRSGRKPFCDGSHTRTGFQSD